MKTFEAITALLTYIVEHPYHKLLAVQPYSDHPEDGHLLTVLVEEVGHPSSEVRFITYLFNGQIPSFNDGHYHTSGFGEDRDQYFAEALKDFRERHRPSTQLPTPEIEDEEESLPETQEGWEAFARDYGFEYHNTDSVDHSISMVQTDGIRSAFVRISTEGNVNGHTDPKLRKQEIEDLAAGF